MRQYFMYELIYISLSIYLTVLFDRISLIPKGKNSSESDLALMAREYPEISNGYYL